MPCCYDSSQRFCETEIMDPTSSECAFARCFPNRRQRKNCSPQRPWKAFGSPAPGTAAGPSSFELPARHQYYLGDSQSWPGGYPRHRMVCIRFRRRTLSQRSRVGRNSSGRRTRKASRPGGGSGARTMAGTGSGRLRPQNTPGFAVGGRRMGTNEQRSPTTGRRQLVGCNCKGTRTRTDHAQCRRHCRNRRNLHGPLQVSIAMPR